MFIGRFERYTMRRSFNTDDVLIVMSQWRWGVAFGAMSVFVLGASLVAPGRWSERTLRDVLDWPWSYLGLGLGAFTLLLGRFTHRWTISHDSITYSNSSTFPRRQRTACLSDLSDLVIHFAPGSDHSGARGPTLPYSVQLRMKDGDEHRLGKFRFAQREAFDEFLITLHAVLPRPLDDPEGLFPEVTEPIAEVLV